MEALARVLVQKKGRRVCLGGVGPKDPEGFIPTSGHGGGRGCKGKERIWGRW